MLNRRYLNSTADTSCQTTNINPPDWSPARHVTSSNGWIWFINFLTEPSYNGNECASVVCRKCSKNTKLSERLLYWCCFTGNYGRESWKRFHKLEAEYGWVSARAINHRDRCSPVLSRAAAAGVDPNTGVPLDARKEAGTKSREHNKWRLRT
jgi:hypothetical protein